jgi:glycerol-3-phosphate acyltransferase PlsY
MKKAAAVAFPKSESPVSFPLLLLAAYLIGAIPTGVILTRLAGLGDIRQAGSGNIGATNVYRVAGRRLGILTLIGDALKGLLPMLYVVLSHRYPPLQVGAAALAVFLGHCFPVYLLFKGGKGVATGLGIYLVLSPLAVLGALATFALVLWKWRYISLASITAAVVLPFLLLWAERSPPLFLAALLISALVVLRHGSNIQRLVNGTENRFRA